VTLRESLVRLLGTLRPRRRDDDLEQELRSHVEFAADEARRQGEAPERTTRAALAQLGGLTQAMEALRDQRSLPVLADIARDVRHACRSLAKAPLFTGVAIVSLAIGIGANSAAFSFADALLLRPPAIPRPGNLMTVGTVAPTQLSPMLLTSHVDYLDIRNRSRSVDGVIAFREASATLAPVAGAVPRPAIGLLTSSNFFDVLALTPTVGRTFRPDEDAVPSRNLVVILSHDTWTSQFSADPSVVGRTIRLNNAEFTIVGVGPQNFSGFDLFTRYQFYIPVMAAPALGTMPPRRLVNDRDARQFSLRARLKRGVTIEHARAELAVLAQDLARAYPETNRGTRIEIRSEIQNRMAQSPPAAGLIAMLGVVSGLVLCAACANVAGLLTSRAPTRARELALRMALGAGPRRVVRLLLTESLLLATAGGLLGLTVGYAGILLFRQFRIPTDLPIAPEFALDRRGLIVSATIALASALLFGLAPAIRSSRTQLTAAMKADDGAGAHRHRTWGRHLLVSVQVTLSVVLLVMATFVYRAFNERFEAGPGFRTDHVAMMWFQPSLVGYSPEDAQQFYHRVVSDARSVPGVTSATLASYMPMDGGVRRVAVAPENFQFPPGRDTVSVPTAAVDEAYFDMLRIPVVRGRPFARTDTLDTPLVAVVNEQFASHYWPSENPVGRRFRVDGSAGPWAQIVGIARNAKYVSLIEPQMEFVYFTFRQRPQTRMALFAESTGDPSQLFAPLLQMVRRVDANQPVFNIRTLEDAYSMRTVVIFRIITQFVGAVGVMGLVLALVGLYALVAYTVGRRTREIGIRMAIGANRRNILGMVLRRGLLVALAGLAAGIVASKGAWSALAAFVPGVMQTNGRFDSIGVVFVTLVILVVTALAAILPAYRASRIAPTEALRCE
jgi:predicted permease